MMVGGDVDWSPSGDREGEAGEGFRVSPTPLSGLRERGGRSGGGEAGEGEITPRCSVRDEGGATEGWHAGRVAARGVP